MALEFPNTLKNARLQQIINAIDAGPGAGKLRLYPSPRPIAGGNPGTLLAELTFSDPSFPSPTGGSVSADPITPGLGLVADDVAWFRVVDSNSSFIIDGDVGVSGSDLNLNSVTIIVGINVDVTSFDLTGGN